MTDILKNTIGPHIYKYYVKWLKLPLNNKRGEATLHRFLNKYMLENEKETRERLEKLPKIEEEPKPIDEKDWDNLIILDACRYDIYKEVTGRDIEKRISVASFTSQYTEKTFSTGDWTDTVFVSANGFHADKTIQDLTGRENIFYERWSCIGDKWDEDILGVSPSDVIEDAETANKLFPSKNLIVHFGQPHQWFLDEDGELVFRPETNYRVGNNGLADREQTIYYYKESIKRALEEIAQFLPKLEGKTVISADHGEVLGENQVYGHFKSSKAKALREVPWDVIENKEKFKEEFNDMK
ncbi:MAG: hypothetical protein ABEJ83_04430 [Candidatus Nanohaloarchaea archaeon]